MESTHNSGSSADMRTGPSTISTEGEQSNKEKKQVPSSSSSSPSSSELSSPDFLDFMPNATTATTTDAKSLGATSPTHDQTYLQSELHNTDLGAEKGDGSPINSHVEAHSDATNTKHVGASESEMGHDHQNSLPLQQGKGGMTNNNVGGFPSGGMLDPHSPVAPSTNESSYFRPPSPEQEYWSFPGNEERTHPANTQGETSKNSAGSTTIPTSVEPHHTLSVTEQGHQSKASGNLETDNKSGSSVSSSSPASESSTQDHVHNSANAATKAPQKRGKGVEFATELIHDDIPIRSFPKHGQQGSDSDDGAGQYLSSSAPATPGASIGLEKQNPPIQVMERPENPTTSFSYRFPSHVFDRHNSKSKSKSNTQWSTTSNESLFSIQMGNTSFCKDMAWMSKSAEMDRPGDMNSSGTLPPSNQPSLPPQPQSLPPQSQPTTPTKFNDISESTAKQHEGSKVTEEKAAETMREVIMENSIETDNTTKGDLKLAEGANHSDKCSSSKGQSHQCHHSNGSTTSFAFNVLADAEKHVSSKRGEEKRKQQNIEPTPDVAAQSQNSPKPTPNAPRKKSWLSCFPCC